jgi:hypothetical protein
MQAAARRGGNILSFFPFLLLSFLFFRKILLTSLPVCAIIKTLPFRPKGESAMIGAAAAACSRWDSFRFSSFANYFWQGVSRFSCNGVPA